MLARNSDLEGALSSVQELEASFNHQFNYPWTFLNDEPFDDEFMSRIRALTKAPVAFGVIPREHWEQAGWINETKAAASRQKMADDNIIYGDSLSYRNMCRFNSGVRRVSCGLRLLMCEPVFLQASSLAAISLVLARRVSSSNLVLSSPAEENTQT
jgi:hypothetical protein